MKLYSSWWHSNKNISKHLDTLHFWLESLSVWLQATSKIHSGQVFTSRCDPVWQFGGINGRLTTRHCVQWYWSKFTLILLIKAKNNTDQITNLKEKLDKRLDKRFWSWNSYFSFWLSDLTSDMLLLLPADLQKCAADWQLLSRPEE